MLYATSSLKKEGLIQNEAFSLVKLKSLINGKNIVKKCFLIKTQGISIAAELTEFRYNAKSKRCIEECR